MPNEQLVLAIDLGSSAVKTALVTSDGTVVRGVRRPIAKQDPRAWWTAVVRAVNELTADGDPHGRIAGIGLSARGGGTLLLDRECRPLQPPGAGLALPDDPRVESLTGRYRRLRPLASHVLQAAQAQPNLGRRPAYVLAAKDFLCLRLTGLAVTDPASGPDAAAWPLDALASAGFPVNALPAVRLPWQAAGVLQQEAAAALQLPSGLSVAVGAHDGVAAQIGTGMIAPGDAALTLGTHAVLRVVTAAVPSRALRYRFYSLWGEADPRTIIGGNARMGGASVAWLAGLTGGRGPFDRVVARLEHEASRIPPDSDGLLFLPFLGGMYHPEQRYAARGAFLGLRVAHGPAQLYRAVLEGVAFALRQIADALAEAGVSPSRIRLTGGGSRSPLWRRILADALGQPLAWSAAPGFEECAGAARCAWVALGRFETIDAAVAAGAPSAGTAIPEASTAEALETAYRQYRSAAETVWEWQLSI